MSQTAYQAGSIVYRLERKPTWRKCEEPFELGTRIETFNGSLLDIRVKPVSGIHEAEGVIIDMRDMEANVLVAWYGGSYKKGCLLIFSERRLGEIPEMKCKKWRRR